ncbi:MAG: rod shape-determining protein RodA [Desulfosalsimonadaceae bacterium]
MFDRRLIQYFDWSLLLLTLIIAAIGVGLIYSSVNAVEAAAASRIHLKQLSWLGIGLFIMTCSFLFSYKKLDRHAPLIYAVCSVLLVAVLLFGKTVGGSTRWLDLGFFLFQPSEPAKIGVILILAHYFAKHVKPWGMGIRELIIPVGFAMVPFLLVLLQPDLGTALLLLLIAGSMAVFAKIERRTFFVLLAAVVILGPLGWFFIEDYQRTRILMLFAPESDPTGAGYHILQSKIAVGSGMLYGKGYMEGTQNILSFLPEQHTDFIFSVLAEEWGFVGAAGLLILFLLFTSFGLNIAYGCRDDFGTLLAFGITAMIFWQTVINIGMVIGLMPVVGMPLPLVSYGGSSVVTTLLGIGILLNISMRRFVKD